MYYTQLIASSGYREGCIFAYNVVLLFRLNFGIFTHKKKKHTHTDGLYSKTPEDANCMKN